MKRKSKRSVLYYTRLMEQQWPVSRYDFILLNELKKEKRKKSEGIIKLHNAQIWFFFFNMISFLIQAIGHDFDNDDYHRYQFSIYFVHMKTLTPVPQKKKKNSSIVRAH